MVSRYSEDGIELNTDGTLRRIVPEHYFTKFSFIPNPDGSFYDIGFGILLGPINETINTLINQLIDSGTLSNMQGGFLSRQVKLKAGEQLFKPGEWKTINSSGDDIKKGIFPLPLREPSAVLFNLLNLLITSGKEISSISEMMTGNVPGQNTKATVAVQAVQEGMRIFNSIYKRIYRSLGKEYKKMFVLNAKYLNPKEEFHVLGLDQGGVITVDDYRDGNIDVIPGADPQMATEEMRNQKAQQLGQLLASGLINPQVATKRILQAQQQPGIEELMQMPPPQPNPEIQIKQAEFQWTQQKEAQELQLKERELAANTALKEAQAMLAITQAQVQQQQVQLDQMNAILQAYQQAQQQELQSNDQNHRQMMDMSNAILSQRNSEADREVTKQTKSKETPTNAK
jgi:chaperonin GroES